MTGFYDIYRNGPEASMTQLLCVVCVCACVQASGGGDKVIHVWDARLNLHCHTFKGHKDTVTVSFTLLLEVVFYLSLD